MAAVVSLVVVVTLALLITRIATVAFTLTGMPLEQARFQARSALTGTGFTTSEAESVVNHPARRRIVMMLMLVSGAGGVSVIGALVLSFGGVESTGTGLRRAGVIVACLLFLLWLARSEPVDRVLRATIERFLRRYTSWELRDYTALLHVHGEWRVSQVPVRGGDWISSRPLDELRLPAEGVTVLGVDRPREHGGREWIGAPRTDLRLQEGDLVVLYGRRATIDDIVRRAVGDPADATGTRPRALDDAGPLGEQV